MTEATRLGVTIGAAAILALLSGCRTATTNTGDSGGDTDTTEPTPTGETGTPGTTVTIYQACAVDFVPTIATGPTSATDANRCDLGTATVSETSYQGVDHVWLFPLEGPYLPGDPVCILSYTLTEAAQRTDCAWGPADVKVDCEWAFDLVVSDAAVEDPLGVCRDTVGYDAENVGELNGTTISRAFHADYAGHAQVRMEIVEGEWRSVGYAGYDATTGAFSYSELDGDPIPL